MNVQSTYFDCSRGEVSHHAAAGHVAPPFLSVSETRAGQFDLFLQSRRQSSLERFSFSAARNSQLRHLFQQSSVNIDITKYNELLFKILVMLDRINDAVEEHIWKPALHPALQPGCRRLAQCLTLSVSA